MIDIDEVLDAYVTCALWSSLDDDGEPLDASYGPQDIASEAYEAMYADVVAFLEANADDVAGLEPADVGHDLWLTRNGHGAGFWDGDYPQELGERLTRAAHVLGECDLYSGDDGALYLCPSTIPEGAPAS